MRTSNKPFYRMYVKERSLLNPLRYILGVAKVKWFVTREQPKNYKNLADELLNSIKLDTSKIKLYD